MPRRNPRPHPPRRPRPHARTPGNLPEAATAAAAEPEDAPDLLLPRLGEWARRVALGLAAALVVARGAWPGEYHDEARSGDGLGWALAMLVAALVAILGAFLAGRLRVRVSWADAAVYAMFTLVALSARQGAEGRVAINLAWEWVGVGVAYALVRNLPRTAGEASAVAGALVASAVALSAYGLYQVAVVQPETRRVYLQNPKAALQMAGISDDAEARKHFEDRLLGSKEPTATVALANSLAGILVGPAVLALAVGLGALGDRSKREGRLVAVLLAAPPMLLVLACLLLTKSRSAYVGLAVGSALVAWQWRRKVPARMAVGLGLGLVTLVAALAVAGFATGQLDKQVLTESTKSLRYRGEYWVGAWRAIWEGDGAWWLGFGPGNFGGPYLRNKLPQASEAISDPHNFLLEVWATAGLPALLALAAALVLGLRAIFGPPRPGPETPGDHRGRSRDDHASTQADEDWGDAPAPPRAGWLVASAGGGWLLAMILRPELSPFAQSANPFEGDLMRWVVLIGAWGWAVLMGMPLWARSAPPAAGLGAGAVAILVNLLAAGGIGFAPVAVVLWALLALGLDRREDRPCGRLRTLGGRGWAFGFAAAWAALAGTFAGTVGPYWSAEAEMARAGAALARGRAIHDQTMEALPRSLSGSERAERAYEQAAPEFRRAEAGFRRAKDVDVYFRRPWIAWALLEYEAWWRRGKPVLPDTLVWRRIDDQLRGAATPPRSPDSLEVQGLRAQIVGDLLGRSGWPEHEIRRLLADRLDALRRSARLDPTDATLRAALSDALAESGVAGDAVVQARKALELDGITPHAEKKLSPEVRERMETRVEGD